MTNQERVKARDINKAAILLYAVKADEMRQRWWVQTAICVYEAAGLVGFIICMFLLLWALSNNFIDIVASQAYIDF